MNGTVGAAGPGRPGRRASVVGLAFAVTALGVALLGHGRLINGDGDLARHLVTGLEILRHGPRFADPFSFTRPGEPFLAYEWLSQAIYAGLYALAGFPGIVALCSLLIAGAVALAVAFVRRSGGDPWLAFMTGGVAAVLTSPHWIARPHLFGFVAVAALPHVLESKRRLVWLPLLFLAWANLHPGFLYGLIMIAAWTAGEALDALRARTPPRYVLVRSAAPFPLALAASLLNPFGWSLHAHAVSWVGSDTVAATMEFQPLELLSTAGVSFLVVCGLIVLGLTRQRERVAWRALLVFGAAVVGALAARRNLPLFALMALPMMAAALAPTVRQLPRRVFGRMRAEFERADVRERKVGLGAAVVVILLMGLDAVVGPISIVPDRFSGEVFPAAAVDRARDAGLEGRLVSEYDWGGYVLFAWPGQRVFIDSMADFYGDALIRDYVTMVGTLSGWRARLDHWRISLVLLPPNRPLVRALRVDDEWRVEHEDAVAVLLVRNVPE